MGPKGGHQPSKSRDIELLQARRAQLSALLAEINHGNVHDRGSQITYFVSASLSEAKRAKRLRRGEVSIDRKLKFVRWAGRRSMVCYQQAYEQERARAGTTGLDPGDQARHERVLGDLCRYMAVVAEIPRVDRAPTPQEHRNQLYWASRAVDHYDRSGLVFTSYAQAMKKMLYTDASVLLAFAATLRYYNLLSHHLVHNDENLAAVLDALTPVRDPRVVGGFQAQFGALAHLVLAQLQGGAVPADVVRRSAQPVLDSWERREPSSVSDELAHAVIVALVGVADAAEFGLGEPSRLIGRALRSGVLLPRCRTLLGAEREFPHNSPLLAHFWTRSTLDGGSLRPQLVRLLEVVRGDASDEQ